MGPPFDLVAVRVKMLPGQNACPRGGPVHYYNLCFDFKGLVCGNFFMVIENTNHVTSIQSIVLNLLTDKQLEVRNSESFSDLFILTVRYIKI